jgi:hypothetical protein
MHKKEMISAAQALVQHLEHDRLEDAQAIAGELDYEISQVTPAPAADHKQKMWVAQTLAAARSAAARNQT